MLWVLLLIGLGAMAFGALQLFAGMMSDDVEAADSNSKNGCLLLIIGLIVLLVDAGVLIYSYR